uniref:Uncharacterized protein n=1 Tax=Ditylenchus dipsaci TaxID=166011 RepID=A0A915E730_9BILA
MLLKGKAVAKFYVNGSASVEPMKTIKVTVRRKTRVNDFVKKAIWKVNLGQNYSFLSAQYFSKKFSKFLDVKENPKVKEGRIYNITIKPVDNYSPCSECSDGAPPALDVVKPEIDSLCETSVWIDESKTVPGRRAKSVLGIAVDLEQKVSEDELIEMFPLGCINNHGFATAAELRQGLKNLQEDISNVVNALSTLHSEIEHEQKNDNWPLTKPLASKIEEIRCLMSRLYLSKPRSSC